MLRGAPAPALGLPSGRWVWENPDPASSRVHRGDSPILSGVGVEGWRGYFSVSDKKQGLASSPGTFQVWEGSTPCLSRAPQAAGLDPGPLQSWVPMSMPGTQQLSI